MHTWPLNTQDKRTLIHWLAACPCMQSPAGRALVLHDLPERIRQRINDDSSVRGHVANIVNTCRQYPWGLEALLDAVVEQDGGADPVRHLFNALKTIRYQPVSQQQIFELRDLLISVHLPDDTQLQMVYYESVSNDAPALKHDEERGFLYCALDFLAQLSVVVDEPYPLLRFVKRLRRFAEGDVVQRIEAWIEAVAHELGCPADEVAPVAPPAQQPAAQRQPFYLLVELIPQIGTAKYQIQAWIWSERRQEMIYADHATHTIDAVPGLILHFLELIEVDRIQARAEPIIELFLPASLLNLEIKDWPSEIPDLPFMLRYCFVVRSQERANQRRFWPRWFGIWHDLGDMHCPAHQVPVATVDTIDHSQLPNMYVQLEQAALLTILCPLPGIIEVQKQFFTTLLFAGVPIALWHRASAGDQISRQQIYRELQQCLLHHLPETTWARQKNAWTPQGQVADKHLTLLWDDPDRLPHRQLYLAAPQ